MRVLPAVACFGLSALINLLPLNFLVILDDFFAKDPVGLTLHLVVSVICSLGILFSVPIALLFFRYRYNRFVVASLDQWGTWLLVVFVGSVLTSALLVITWAFGWRDGAISLARSMSS